MQKKIRTLITAKHSVLKGYQDLLFSEPDDKQLQIYFDNWSNYFRIISEVLEIEVSVGDLIGDNFDTKKFISNFLNSYVKVDTLGDKITEKLGIETYIYYNILSNLAALHYTLSFMALLDKYNVDDSNDIVKKERDFALDYIEEYRKDYTSIKFIHYKYFNKTEIELFENLNNELENNIFNHTVLNERTSDLYSELNIHYLETDFNLHLAEMYIDELRKCNVGKKSWHKYENLCFDILKFLFMPNFKHIFTQKRTLDNHQVRDAILPNYQDEGFWKYIKDEFNSKNIIIEFKNNSEKTLDKDSLNQLRIYLSKKTIGRFGMLFIRNSPNKSILIAQKLAYEESNILILIINDELLKKLMLCKALFGNCEDYLLKEKIKFELDY